MGAAWFGPLPTPRSGSRLVLPKAEALAVSEQRLRVQAEQDAERSIARARELQDQLTRVAGDRGLPTDDPMALVDALSRPVGQAARHAGDRIAAGRPRPHDNFVLELASALRSSSSANTAENVSFGVSRPGTSGRLR